MDARILARRLLAGFTVFVILLLALLLIYGATSPEPSAGLGAAAVVFFSPFILGFLALFWGIYYAWPALTRPFGGTKKTKDFKVVVNPENPKINLEEKDSSFEEILQHKVAINFAWNLQSVLAIVCIIFLVTGTVLLVAFAVTGGGGPSGKVFYGYGAMQLGMTLWVIGTLGAVLLRLLSHRTHK